MKRNTRTWSLLPAVAGVLLLTCGTVTLAEPPEVPDVPEGESVVPLDSQFDVPMRWAHCLKKKNATQCQDCCDGACGAGRSCLNKCYAECLTLPAARADDFAALSEALDSGGMPVHAPAIYILGSPPKKLLKLRA